MAIRILIVDDDMLLACAGALQLWDDRAGDALASRYVRLARAEGALSDLPSALNALSVMRLLAGDLTAADSLATEAQTIAEAMDVRAAPYAALGLAALRGHEHPALALINIRSGQPGRSEGAMRTLSRLAMAAGTDWALGVQAPSQALLSDREDAPDVSDPGLERRSAAARRDGYRGTAPPARAGC